jgi:hypothetical protein
VLKGKLITILLIGAGIAIELAVYFAVWSAFQTVPGAVVVGGLVLAFMLWLAVFARR